MGSCRQAASYYLIHVNRDPWRLNACLWHNHLIHLCNAYVSKSVVRDKTNLIRVQICELPGAKFILSCKPTKRIQLDLRIKLVLRKGSGLEKLWDSFLPEKHISKSKLYKSRQRGWRGNEATLSKSLINIFANKYGYVCYTEMHRFWYSEHLHDHYNFIDDTIISSIRKSNYCEKIDGWHGEVWVIFSYNKFPIQIFRSAAQSISDTKT